MRLRPRADKDSPSGTGRAIHHRPTEPPFNDGPVASPTGVAVVPPMVSEGTSEMELDTLTLLSRDATRRRLRFADSAVVAHYDLDEPAREIAAHEIVMRYGGARYRRVGLE